MVAILEQINELLFAAVLIVSFSLLAYIVLQNWRSDIVRSLGVLLAGVIIAYSGDLLLARAQRPATIEFLGRAQWLGIVLVPAGYIHFANALLAFGSANTIAQRWRRSVYAAYIGSLAIFLLVVLGTNLVIYTGSPSGPVARFNAGPLFWFYVLFFGLAIASALIAILIVRRSALTPAQRRRLSYLGATFAAPGDRCLSVSADSFTECDTTHSDSGVTGGCQSDCDRDAYRHDLFGSVSRHADPGTID